MWQTILKILFTGFVLVTAYYALQRIWTSQIDLGSWFRGASMIIPVKSATAISILQVPLLSATPLSFSYQDRTASYKRGADWESEYRKHSFPPNKDGVTLSPAEWVEDPFAKDQRVIGFDDTAPEYIKFRVTIGAGAGKLVFREIARAGTNGVAHRRLWFQIIRPGQSSVGWCPDSKSIKLSPMKLPGGEKLSVNETEIPLTLLSTEALQPNEGDEIEILFVSFPQDGIGGPFDIGAVKRYSLIGDWHLIELSVLQYP